MYIYILLFLPSLNKSSLNTPSLSICDVYSIKSKFSNTLNYVCFYYMFFIFHVFTSQIIGKNI